MDDRTILFLKSSASLKQEVCKKHTVARLLEVAATLVENPTPRCIKTSKADYNSLVNDSKIEELIVGRYRKLEKLESGEVVIYEINA